MKDEKLIRRDLGRVLADARKTAGLTQKQVEVATGINQHQISGYEHGRTLPFDRGLVLCELYGLSTEEVFEAIKFT